MPIWLVCVSILHSRLHFSISLSLVKKSIHLYNGTLWVTDTVVWHMLQATDTLAAFSWPETLKKKYTMLYMFFFTMGPYG